MQVDLKALEFPAIQRLLERLTATPYGADAARGLEPAPNLDAARALQTAVTVARQRLDAGTLPRLGQLPDVRAALRQASNPGAALPVQALHNLQTIMRQARELADQLADTPEIYPADLNKLYPPEGLEERLSACLNPGGSLREDASPALIEAFEQRGRLRYEVEAVVKKRLAASDVAQKGEDALKVQWHQERAVMVLRGEAANAVKGVRRGTAMGGRDQIVEPIEAVPLNNQLDTVNSQINTEQQRLLRELTDVVRQYGEPLELMLTALTWIDLASAAAQLSAQMNAHAPRLEAEAGVELIEAYHPLLLLQFAEGNGPQPVPLSIRLDGEQPLLLITGPNTGGKTVALKTLGLLVTMAWCGLHIPAEQDCRIGRFDQVMVDVGDHQSLFHHLSTFAGHVEVLKRILDHAGSETLILLDELGTGTDPDEGAALAMAMLDELRARGTRGIVNTHLAPLKDYAAQHAGIVNASMQFDAETLSPTYRLLIGEPGVSFGLTIAEKNGLPAQLVARAREHFAELPTAQAGGDAGKA
ncbi:MULTISPECIES: DNA mismatch repair protein MutS [unclassified Thioalkalivibrio]|uniref:endonuclease MutS2 n=1 Tax=unclassified Thioalkalivibrio TaxID=2621013 RepID=UPI000371FD4A|nr:MULTISPECIES: DNA mismatch repair protein MutS [unclassified Thioalkalivibrio]